jgi:hypothetical protein
MRCSGALSCAALTPSPLERSDVTDANDRRLLAVGKRCELRLPFRDPV